MTNSHGSNPRDPAGLRVHVAASLPRLADELAEVLTVAGTDPMSPELLAVPSFGMARWLRLELAQRLGASSAPTGARRRDGVAANIEIAFPDALRRAVLAAGRAPGEADPWEVERLAWTILPVLERAADPVVAFSTTNTDGGARYGLARRVADLFDRYAVHRPAMVAAWAAGRDVDANLEPIGPDWAWQPRLWRAARERIDRPSAPELLPQLLARVRAAELTLDLPPRVSLFGLTTLPGGMTFLDVIDAVATQHSVHLCLFRPAPGLVDVVRPVVAAKIAEAPSSGTSRRTADRTADVVAHPLVRSWARPYREALVLLTAAEAAGRFDPVIPIPDPATEPVTVLARLQADVRACRAPAGDFVAGPDDRSVEVHTCYGATRQAEVLRDVILGRLASQADLSEDDILVVSPSIDTFAPLVEAAFGPPARRGSLDEADPESANGAATPRLSYHVTDRSLRETHPTLGAFGALLELLEGRFSASAVLDFLALAPVRRRFDLSDDDLTTIARWVGQVDLRWGIDGPHRQEWGIPADFATGSWRAGLDRLMVGIAISDDLDSLAVGDIVPLGVEGSDLGTAGRLHDAIDQLAALAADAAHSRSPEQWCELLLGASTQLFATPPNEPHQRAALVELVATLAEESASATVSVTLADIRRALGDRLTGFARRSDFFRGGVTISSLTPLRGIPFRLVCVLGLDEAAFGAATLDGGDLVAASPHVGDRDDRAETRQALLETVLAAEQLVVICSGHDVVTNQPQPAAVPLAELRDAVLATVSPNDRPRISAQLDIRHPRQAFAPRNFDAAATESDRPWSFDPIARAGAQARRAASNESAPFLAEPLAGAPDAVVELADLCRFLRQPVREFLTGELELRLPRDPAETAEDLRTSVVALDEWKAADRLLDVVLDGGDPAVWHRRETALGSLPPGTLGVDRAREIAALVDELAVVAAAAGYERGRSRSQTIGVTLDDGTRLVGTVRDAGATQPGPVTVTYSRFKPDKLLVPWLELMGLAAHDPTTPWRAVFISRRASGRGIQTTTLMPTGDDRGEIETGARAALGVALDCLWRGRREPIPLFKSLSRQVHDGTATANDWHNRGGWADGDDPASRLVFSDVDLTALRRLPATEADPAGPATGRLDRYADYLWGAMERSTTRTVTTADDRSGL